MKHCVTSSGIKEERIQEQKTKIGKGNKDLTGELENKIKTINISMEK